MGRGENKIRVTETLSHWKPVLYVSEKEKERVKPGMSSPVSLCLTAGPGPHKMPQLLWSDSAGQLAQSSAHNSLQALCYVPFLFLLLFFKVIVAGDMNKRKHRAVRRTEDRSGGGAGGNTPQRTYSERFCCSFPLEAQEQGHTGCAPDSPQPGVLQSPGPAWQDGR